MTFCPQLAFGTISLTSDWVFGDDSKQYRCYIGKIVNKQNIIRDRIPRSRFSYAYTLGLLPNNTAEDVKKTKALNRLMDVQAGLRLCCLHLQGYFCRCK